MRRALAIGSLVFLLPAAAGAQEAGTPDGRVRVGAEAVAQGVRAHGNVGLYGLDHTLTAGPGGVRFTNPPMYGALGSRGGEYEELFGPRVANTTIGSGGITSGFDAAGRLSVLGWPGPGMYDHVNFVNISRGSPNQGAPLNAGSFGGFYANGTVSWMTPEFGWTQVSQGWAAETTETLVTVLRNEGICREMTVTDVVDPVDDVLARNFRFATLPGPCRPETSFAYYANMNPTTSRAPRVPSVGDALADNVSDFGTVWDEGSASMLHFRPYRVDPASATRVATGQPGVADALDAVAGAHGPGVYVAVAGHGRAPEFQAGLESAGLVREEAESTPLLDPYFDAQVEGFSFSPAAFGRTAGGFGGQRPDEDGSYTVYLAAAEHPLEAIGTIERARARGFARIRADAEADWTQWISRARLPATADPQTIAVSRRALMLIRTAQDRRTGAIVANATTQTPYRQDWVRDGAFFNYALLLAGYPEMAVRHSDFYRRVYRAGGTWDSFYYPDGAEAGFVFPYEIDSQAFALWALWLPYAMGGADGNYLLRVWPAIRDTATALLACTDPVSKLQCRAAEDDAVVPTQGAQGAATVYLALRAAVAAADSIVHITGHHTERNLWAARADELRTATIARLCFTGRCPGGRGGVYLVWPSRLIDPADPRTAALAQASMQPFADELDARAAFAQPPVHGFLQYPMEPILALAPYWNPGDPARDAALDGWMRWLTHDVPEPGVLHYGERIFHCGGQPPFCEDGRRYLHTIGFPHIWSGAELYLAAAFTYGVTGCPPGTTRIGEAPCV